MIVILAEKPDQAKKYGEVFDKVWYKEGNKKFSGFFKAKDPKLFNGQVVCITWAIGHLVELEEPAYYHEEWADKTRIDTLPLVPESVEYHVSKGKQKQFDTIKYLFQKADTIVWAGDIDREGCAISYLISQESRVLEDTSKTFKRFWVDELSPTTIFNGFQNLQSIELSTRLAKEAQARQISDWLVGINGTRLYNNLLRKAGLQGFFAVGRVMSPTLMMIYKREKERESFVQETYYELEADFEHSNGSYRGKVVVEQDDYWKQRINSPELIKTKLQTLLGENSDIYSAKVEEVVEELKEKASEKLFSLASIQKYISDTLGYSPKETLKACQRLYEKEHVLTYPRGNSSHISSKRYNIIAGRVQEYAALLGGVELVNFEPSSRYVDDKKSAVHEAITPTATIPTKQQIESYSELEKACYWEVLRRTVAMFLPKFEYKETTITTNVSGLLFKTVGRIPHAPGWKSLYSESNDNNSELPIVNEGDSTLCRPDIVEKKTTNKPLYTEGTLLEAMVNAGTKESDIADTMKEVNGIGTPATRADILEKLMMPKKVGQEVIGYGYVEKKGKNLSLTPLGRTFCQALEKDSLLSSAHLTAKWELFLNKIGKGEKEQGDFFIGVIKYINHMVNTLPNEIQSIDWSSNIKEIEESKVTQLGNCPKCGNKVLYYTNAKAANCSSRTKESSGCGFVIWRTVAGKKLTIPQMTQLVTKKRTNLIKGFKKKDGESFEAVILLDDDFNPTFSAPTPKKIKN